ncbi:MAG: response regulator transcription factor [Verrucomicrobiae bacterium]|nr:response regulator transcription factor [Verrucomicrobiae bacterium]MCX7723339.1 response regulator transcription factor [Verrucomicrobiae bacterium]MDW7978980.1 response regulator transcription factor [Verrucomicrobiales bacterium]
MKILIADDHEIVRRGLRDLLVKELGSVQVEEAGDSRTTMELLGKGPWDLIVLDINMPGRNGLEVLSEARRLCPKTPVLILSMYPEEEFALRAFKLGAAGYINKRSAASELITAVKKVMTGGKYVTSELAEKLAAVLSGEVSHEPHEILSARELQVLRLIAMGKTMKEIAAELALSEKTVATYRARVAEKLGLSTNVELTRYAIRHRLAE